MDNNINAQAEPQISRKSPLVQACEKGHLEIVKYLVDSGKADITARSHEAFLMASKNGHLEVVRYLAGKIGADIASIEEKIVQAIYTVIHNKDAEEFFNIIIFIAG